MMVATARRARCPHRNDGTETLRRQCRQNAQQQAKGIEAPMIRPRLGALGAKGRVAEEMMRPSGAATLS